MENPPNFCCICTGDKQEFHPITETDENEVKYSEKLAICDPKQVSHTPFMKNFSLKPPIFVGLERPNLEPLQHLHRQAKHRL